MEEGDELILKVGGDGTCKTKKASATVHTETLAIVLGPEEYEVIYQTYKLQKSYS